MLGSNPIFVLGICCVLVAVASLAGGWLPIVVRLTHARLQIAISFVAGLMLGLALLHFIPDATEELHSLDRTVAWALAGFLVMFFLQRFFHYHTHDVPGEAAETVEAHEERSEAHETSHHGHSHDHEHVHGHEHKHGHHEEHDEHGHGGHAPHRLSWVGAAAGLTLHSLLDGVALAAAVSIGSQGQGTLIGLGTALAVILHKPFDAMAISTLMAAGGESRSARHWLNLLYALVTPLGVLSFYLGMSHFAESNATVLGSALGFCAGTFLCISCSDLLPELQFHSHDRVWLSLALLAGLGVAIVILFAETEGSEHGHGAHSAMKWQVPTTSRVAYSGLHSRSHRMLGVRCWSLDIPLRSRRASTIPRSRMGTTNRDDSLRRRLQTRIAGRGVRSAVPAFSPFPMICGSRSWAGGRKSGISAKTCFTAKTVEPLEFNLLPLHAHESA